MINTADGIPRPNMTPMIDVVFQLLSFFLVTMKFKTLDMKIEAHLPRDRSIGNPIPIHTPPAPKITARLSATQPGVVRIKVGPRTIGTTADADVFDRLADAARAVRARHVSFGGDPDQIEAEIDASRLVPTGAVIAAIDAFTAADMTKVTFVGTPLASAAPRDN